MEKIEQEISLDFESVYDSFSADVWRICVLYFGGRKADVEDASQETFLRYWKADPKPGDAQHTKAWLLVTAGNICKDMLKRKGRHDVSIDNLAEVGANDPEHSDILEKLLLLPTKLKTAIYLFYYEDMSAKEIAAEMGTTESTVFVYLNRGRKQLKTILENE